MTGTIILTNEDIINIKKQIEGAKKEIHKTEKYILACKSTVENLRKSIELSKKKLALGEIKREIVNGIDLAELTLPFHCSFEGALKRHRKGIVTSSYRGRMEYQLHDIDPHKVDYCPTMIFEGFNLAELIKSMNIIREEK